VNLVCLAGFLRIVRGALLEHFAGAILNIHPSLLPAFPGLRAPEQAIEYGVKIAGCTVHLVERGVDSGPVVMQSSVSVHDDDDAATLSERILEQEHLLYPQAVRLWSSKKLQIIGRRVVRCPTRGVDGLASSTQTSEAKN